MTHDELLEEIDWVYNLKTKDEDNLASINASIPAAIKALRAVVELHKPYESTDMGLICAFCKDMNSVEHWYPCPTIQAIEKELQ